MNERIAPRCENYTLRTMAAARESDGEGATGLAGQLSETVDSGKRRDGGLLGSDDIGPIGRPNAAIPVPGEPVL